MYSKELIEQVKKVYPNSKTINDLAESGSVWLGRHLDDSSSGSISVNEILLATSLEELQNKARLQKIKIDLYRKWCDEDPRKILKNA